MNNITITGRLTADPELKHTQNGKAWCKFNVAVDDGFGDKKRTDFFQVVCWEKTAEVAAEYLKKGKKVLVNGSMISSKKDDKTYWQIRANSYGGIEFLEPKKESDGSNSNSNSNPSNNTQNNNSAEVIDDDEFPF